MSSRRKVRKYRYGDLGVADNPPKLMIPSHEWSRVFQHDMEKVERLYWLLETGTKEKLETFLFVQGCEDYILDF